MVVIQQEELVSQLQDQHYEQYMEHVHSQLLLHQRQQFAQLHLLHHQQLPVAVETSPSNEMVEFHTEAGVEAETCHHDDEVAMVKDAEMNGGASDVALLATSPVSDEQHVEDDEDADESDIDDHQDTLTGNDDLEYVVYC